MTYYPGNANNNGGYGNQNGQPGGSDNPGPWDTNPYDPQDPPDPGSSGCDGVMSPIGADGQWLPYDQQECVDEATYQHRLQLGHEVQGGGANEGRNNNPNAGGPQPAGRPNYGPVPVFHAPQFSWGETWQAPSQADAENDPGYQFGLNQGLKALQQSAAAKGSLLTGGTLKGLNDYGLAAARQQYGDVFNRNLRGYETRYGTARDIYDRQFAGAQAEFAPVYGGWLQNAHGADLGWANNWSNWWKDNPDILSILNGQ